MRKEDLLKYKDNTSGGGNYSSIPQNRVTNLNTVNHNHISISIWYTLIYHR